jgi:hypothetical protein
MFAITPGDAAVPVDAPAERCRLWGATPLQAAQQAEEAQQQLAATQQQLAVSKQQLAELQAQVCSDGRWPALQP